MVKIEEIIEALLTLDVVRHTIKHGEIDSVKLAERIKAEGIAPPDGYVIVPIEPTNDMYISAIVHTDDLTDVESDAQECADNFHCRTGQVIAIYKTMLASAPKHEDVK